jgi:hypothetical protein
LPLSPDFAGETPAIEGKPTFSLAVKFLVGLMVLLPIVPEARLTLFDLAAIALILAHWRMVIERFRVMMIVLAVSLLAMTISADVNGSGWLALTSRSYPMLALAIEMVAYYILISRSNDTGRAGLALGVMLGICFHYFYPTDLRALDDPIKFLLGIPLGVGLLALYALTVARISAPVALAAALMVAYAIFCFMVGARSNGGVFVVSAILVVALNFLRIPAGYAKFAPLIIALSLVLAYAFTELYTWLAIKGLFGDRAAGIAFFQSSFGSILLGGRPEIVVNLIGIREAPLLGVGIMNYPSIYLYDMINLSVYAQNDVLDSENILYHSVLFGTAFETGLISAAFWAAVLYRAFFVVPLLATIPTNTRIFVMPLIIITVWHILYSPPMPYNRFIMGIGLAFVFYIYADWKRQRDASNDPQPEAGYDREPDKGGDPVLSA